MAIFNDDGGTMTEAKWVPLHKKILADVQTLEFMDFENALVSAEIRIAFDDDNTFNTVSRLIKNYVEVQKAKLGNVAMTGAMAAGLAPLLPGNQLALADRGGPAAGLGPAAPEGPPPPRDVVRAVLGWSDLDEEMKPRRLGAMDKNRRR